MIIPNRKIIFEVDGQKINFGTSFQTSGVGEANEISNVGAGIGIYRDKIGATLNLKSLIAGTGINVVENSNDITLESTESAAHEIGGVTHLPDTLLNLNSRISDTNLIPEERTISTGTGLLGGGNLSVDRLFSINYGVTSGTVTEGDDSRIPTQNENNALQGTDGIPSATNKFVTNSDTRLNEIVYKYELDNTNLGNSGADLVGVNGITGSTYNNLQDTINNYSSAGQLSGGLINDAGGGTCNVSEGIGKIRISDAHSAKLLDFDWNESNGLSIPSDSTRYIGVEYNSGSPQITIKSSDTWNYHTEFPLGSVVRDNSKLHIYNNPHFVANSISHLLTRLYATNPLERDIRKGGLIIGETGVRNITVSSGSLWDRANEFIIDSIDTSAGGDFDSYTSAGPESYGDTQWDNLNYDNSGILTELTVNRFANLWFYIEANKNLVCVYGTSQYANSATAQTESPPSVLPRRIQAAGRLIGRIVFQKGSTSAILIQSAFDESFSPTLASDHGNLAGLMDDDHTQYLLSNALRSITIGDLENNSFIINQNDVTNNPQALIIENTGSGNSLQINTNDFIVDNTGNVSLAKNITLTDTTTSTEGVIMKGAMRFIHNFHHPTGDTAIPVGYNLFIGEGAGNFTVGSTAIVSTQGSDNVGLGRSSLDVLTTGYRNVAIGSFSLSGLTSGSHNMALGYTSMSTTISSSFCTALGSSTLVFNQSSYNTAVGYSALYKNKDGIFNLGLGIRAGERISGGVNPNETSEYSIYIGDDTRALADGDTNEIVIGSQVTGNGSNTVTIGNSSITDAYIQGDIHLISGKRIYGTTTPLILGKNGTPNRVSDADAVYFGEDIEIDGVAHFDGEVYHRNTTYISGHMFVGDDLDTMRGSGNDSAFRWSTAQNHHALILGLAVGATSQSGNFIITTLNNRTKDHGLNLTSNPRLCLYSATDPTVDSTKYGLLQHNNTDFILSVGSGAFKIDSNAQITGQIAPTTITVSIPTGTTQTIDFDNGNGQTIDLDSATGNVTLTLSNPLQGATYTLKVIQGSTARNLIWPGTVKWSSGTPPTITVTNDAVDLVFLWYDGTNFYGQFYQDHQ